MNHFIRITFAAVLFCAGFLLGLEACLRTGVCNIGSEISFAEAYLWTAAGSFCLAFVAASIYHLTIHRLSKSPPAWAIAIGMSISTASPFIVFGFLGVGTSLFTNWWVLFFVVLGAMASGIGYIWHPTVTANKSGPGSTTRNSTN